jgi:hypothetical protein
MTKIHQLAFNFGLDYARTHAETPRDREIIDMIGEYLARDEAAGGRKEIHYMFSGFAMTMLPHKHPKDENMLWKRENGRFTLLVEPGAILENGAATQYGVPYGSRARLIMFYLQTEAIRTKSQVVRLGSSMTEWMRKMNIPTGGKNYEQVRDQARRISACRLTVGWTAETGHSGFRRENIVGAMLIPPKKAGQGGGPLWEETAQLSDGFYKALVEHPVPCDANAISVLQNKSHAMDVYVWLCYRLRWITEDKLVPWEALYQQFGHGYSNIRQFKWRFKSTISEALAVYKDAKVEVGDRGLTLKPSKPAVESRSVHQVLLPSAKPEAEVA